MTRERAAELWPVMKAFGEGRIIQCLNHGGGNWRDMPDAPGWFDDIAYNYRIKPEPREFLLRVYDSGEVGYGYKINEVTKPIQNTALIKVREVLP